MASLSFSDTVFSYLVEYNLDSLTIIDLAKSGVLGTVRDLNRVRPVQQTEFAPTGGSNFSHITTYVDTSVITQNLIVGATGDFEESLLKLNTNQFFKLREWLILTDFGRGLNSLGPWQMFHFKVTRI